MLKFDPSRGGGAQCRRTTRSVVHPIGERARGAYSGAQWLLRLRSPEKDMGSGDQSSVETLHEFSYTFPPNMMVVIVFCTSPDSMNPGNLAVTMAERGRLAPRGQGTRPCRPILQRRKGFGRQVGPRVVIWGRLSTSTASVMGVVVKVREEAKGRARRHGDIAFAHRARNDPCDQCGQAGLVFLALAGPAVRRLGDSAPRRWPAGSPAMSPAQWQRPRMWICVGPRDPATKPSRGWLWVVVRNPRLILVEIASARNNVTAKARAFLGRQPPVMVLL